MLVAYCKIFMPHTPETNQNPNERGEELKILITGDKPKNLLVENSLSSALPYSKQMSDALETVSARAIGQIIKDNPGKKIILLTGLELGIEQAAASRALEMNVAVKAFVPFKNHGENWSPENRRQHAELIHQIKERGGAIETSDKEYNPQRTQLRDYRMVDEANQIITLHQPDAKPAHQKTLDYAEKHSKTVVNIWNDAEKQLNEIARSFVVNSNAQRIFDSGEPVSSKQREATETQNIRIGKIEIRERITREDVQSNKDRTFLFGDNLVQRGFGGQAKEMRGEPNAVGIPTKKAPDNKPTSFLTDKELAENKRAIDEAFKRIPENVVLVIPKGGIGTGLARLSDKAPQTFAYLNEKLAAIGFDNLRGKEIMTARNPVQSSVNDKNVVAENKLTADLKEVRVRNNSKESATQTRRLDLDRINAPNLKLLAPTDLEVEALKIDRTEALAGYAARLREDYRADKDNLRGGLKSLSDALDKNTEIVVSCACSRGEACHADVVKMAIEKVNDYVKNRLVAEVQKRDTGNIQIEQTQKPSKNSIIRQNPRTARAIAEILAVTDSDKILAGINQTDSRNQSEQASFLGQKSQFVRDVYERGGMVSEGVLIVPQEKLSLSPVVFVTTQEYAVKKITEILRDEAKAKEFAPLVVEYGNKIAGLTADTETRLKVFASVYNALEGKGAILEERKNPHQSKELSLELRFENSLFEIARLAEEMHRLEPLDKIEFVPLNVYEQADTERESAANYSENLDENRIVEAIYEDAVSRDALSEQIQTESKDELSHYEGRTSAPEGYERIDLTDGLPQIPEQASEFELHRLFGKTLPEIDRQLENGVSVKDVLKPFNEAVWQSAKDDVLNRLESIYQKQKLAEINEKLENASLSESQREKLEAEKTRFINAVLTPTSAELRQILHLPEEIKFYEAKLENFKSSESLETSRDEKKAERSEINHRLKTLESVSEAQKLENSSEIAEAIALEKTNLETEIAAINRQIAERSVIESNLADLRQQEAMREAKRSEKTIAQVAGGTNAKLSQKIEAQLQKMEIGRQNIIVLDAPGEYRVAQVAAEKTFYQKNRQEIARLQVQIAETKESSIKAEQEKTARRELNKIKEAKPNFAFRLENSNEIISGNFSAQTVTERNFAAAYVGFQLKQPETRLRHENERYRLYAARLESATTRSEVMKTASEIRAENAALGMKWKDSDKNQKQQPRPLSAKEMQFLFTEAAPRHFTSEMVVAKLAYAHAGESRRLATSGLIRGEIAPSAEAQKLLDSLEERESRRDLKDALLATKHFFESLKTANENLRYKNEFDHLEIYRLLPPQEKDFVYSSATQQKENLEYRLAYKQQQFIRGDVLNRENADSKLELSQAEKSFHLASQLNQARILGDRFESASLKSSEISERDFHAAQIVLQNHGSERIKSFAGELRRSESLDDKKLGEILETFGNAETIKNADKTIVSIKLAENNLVSKDAYRELLERFYPADEREMLKYKFTNFSEKTLESARTKAQDKTIEGWRENLKNNIYAGSTASATVFATEREVSEQLSDINRLQKAARAARDENTNLLEKYAACAAAKIRNQNLVVPERIEQKQIVTVALSRDRAENSLPGTADNRFFQAAQKEIAIGDWRKFAENEKQISENTTEIKRSFAEIADKQQILEADKSKTFEIRSSDKLQEIYQNARNAEENRLLTVAVRNSFEKGEIKELGGKTVQDLVAESDVERIKTLSADGARIRLEPVYKESEEYDRQALKFADELEKAHELSKQNAPLEEISKAFATAEQARDLLTEKIETAERQSENAPLSLRLYEAGIARAERRLLTESVAEKYAAKILPENEKVLDLTTVFTPEEREQIKQRAALDAKEKLEPKELGADHRKISPEAQRQAVATFKQLERAANVFQLSNDAGKISEAFAALDREAASLNKVRQDYSKAEKLALLRDGVKADLVDLVQKNQGGQKSDLTQQTTEILRQNLVKTGLLELTGGEPQIQTLSREISERIEAKQNSAVKGINNSNQHSAQTIQLGNEREGEIKTGAPQNQKARESFVYAR